jgi:hypothetical protein
VARRKASSVLRGAASRSSIEPTFQVLLCCRGHRHELEGLMPSNAPHAARPQPKRLPALGNTQLERKAPTGPLGFGKCLDERTAFGNVQRATQVRVPAQELVEEQVGVAAIHAPPLAAAEGLHGGLVHEARLAC